MRAIRIDFTTGTVDWTTRVTGGAALLQRASVAMVTRLGSDVVAPSRGTELARRLHQGRAYDLLSAQHELNFAVLRARNSLREFEDETMAVEDRVGNITAEIEAASAGALQIRLEVTDLAGNLTVLQQPL